MQAFQKHSALRQPTARRFVSLASTDAYFPWFHEVSCGEPPGTRHGIVFPTRFRAALFVLLVVSVSSLPNPAQGSAHVSVNASQELWPRASVIVGDHSAAVDEIAHAASQDLAARTNAVEIPSIEVARWLFSSMADPKIRLGAKRGADILKAFMSESRSGTTSFWSEFSLATFQEIAGEDPAVVGTLERALKHAKADDVSPEIIARTKGIMGHAQQSRGLLDQAKRTFEDLESDPIEQGHATVHLGEIALSTHGVEAGLEIWMAHPHGTTAAVIVIVNEADALWSLNPEKSYQLVAEALARLKPQVTLATPEFQAAVSQLAARARANAVLLAPDRATIASGETTQK